MDFIGLGDSSRVGRRKSGLSVLSSHHDACGNLDPQSDGSVREMQTHLAARPLKGTQKPDKDVRVLFAAQPSSKAILFIHGYGGDVITTWSDFHDLLLGCAKCSGQDLFFYGYDGLRADMNASAAIFRTFLDRLFGKTASILADNLPLSASRPSTFRYDELVIAAHSLGAVISRRALLDATRKNPTGSRK